ncbi:MAG: hypothetical protein AAGA33_00200 [Pseudomonadota bacterium]
MQDPVNANPESLDKFLRVLQSLPRGHSFGHYAGRRWGTTLSEAGNGSRFKLFAEELGGTEIVSFNLYLVGSDRPRLKPCEMPADKAINFVMGFMAER